MPKLGNLTVSQQGFGAMGLSNAYGPADDAEFDPHAAPRGRIGHHVFRHRHRIWRGTQ